MCVNRSHLVQESLGNTNDHLPDAGANQGVSEGCLTGHKGYEVNTNVLNEGLDGPKTGDMFTSTVPNDEFDEVTLGSLDKLEVHVDVLDMLHNGRRNAWCGVRARGSRPGIVVKVKRKGKNLDQGSLGTLDGDQTRLDRDLDTFRNGQFFVLVDIPHRGGGKKKEKTTGVKKGKDRRVMR